MKTSFWYCRGKQITLWNDAVYDNRLIKLEKFTVPIVKNKQWQRPGGVAPPVGMEKYIGKDVKLNNNVSAKAHCVLN